MGCVLHTAQYECRTRRTHCGMPQDARIQKLVVGVHIPDNDLQHIVTLARNRITLHHLGQCLNMPFKVVPVLVCMFSHGDGQQHLDLEPCLPWVENDHLPLDQAGIFKITYAPPARCPRHTRNVSQIDLTAPCVVLQSIKQAPVSQ